MSKWTRANPLAAVPGYNVPRGHFANGYTNGGDRVGFNKGGKVKSKKIIIIGDILHSRVALSNIYGLFTMCAKVKVCGPPHLLPLGIEDLGVEIEYNIDNYV